MQGGFQPPPGGGSGYGGAPPPASPPGYAPGYRPPPLGPYGPNAPAPASFGAYEFNELENSILARTAGRARTWGFISAALGACQLLGGGCGAVARPELAAFVPYGIVMLIVGITFVGVGTSLKRVVTTQGNDVAHLMEAMQKLGNAFVIQSITFAIMIALVAIAVVLCVFVFAVAMARGP